MECAILGLPILFPVFVASNLVLFCLINIMSVRCWDLGSDLQVSGINCKPGSEGLVHASIVENFNFSQSLENFNLATRFNRCLFSITFQL
jgi:hypothetical protein